MSWEHRWEGLRLRKAPHVWGWDILPRAVSAGIWRSVRLEPISDDGFDWIYYWTREINPQFAPLAVRFQLHTAGDTDGLLLRFTGSSPDHSFEFDWPLEFIAGGCSIPVPQPRLWWPKGYGQANLYTISARLYRGETLLAERKDQIGSACDPDRNNADRWTGRRARCIAHLPGALGPRTRPEPPFSHPRERYPCDGQRHQLGPPGRIPQPGRHASPPGVGPGR